MCLKKNPNFLMVEIPSKNLNTTKMNLKDEESTKKPMVSKKAKGGAKGVKAFTTHAYSLACLRLNFNKDNGVPSGKKRMGLFKEGHHLNKGGMKVKQLLACACNKYST